MPLRPRRRGLVRSALVSIIAGIALQFTVGPPAYSTPTQSEVLSESISLYFEGDAAGAIELLKDTLATLQQRGGPVSDGLLLAAQLAEFYVKTENSAGILQAAEILREMNRPYGDFLLSVQIEYFVARSELLVGDIPTARRRLEDALVTLDIPLADGLNLYLSVVASLGEAYQLEGKIREGDISMQRGLAAAAAARPDLSQYDTAVFLSALGNHYMETRQLRRAAQVFDALLDAGDVLGNSIDAYALAVQILRLKVDLGEFQEAANLIAELPAWERGLSAVPSTKQAHAKFLSLAVAAETGTLGEALAAHDWVTAWLTQEEYPRPFYEAATELLRVRAYLRAGEVDLAALAMPNADRIAGLGAYLTSMESMLLSEIDAANGEPTSALAHATDAFDTMNSFLRAVKNGTTLADVQSTWHEKLVVEAFINSAVKKSSYGLLTPNEMERVFSALQILNRDNSPTGVSARGARLMARTELEGTILRSREQINGFGIAFADGAVNKLSERISRGPGEANEQPWDLTFAQFVEYIAAMQNLDDHIQLNNPDYFSASQNQDVSLDTAGPVVRADEALLVHTFVGEALVIACLSNGEFSLFSSSVSQATVQAHTRILRDSLTSTHPPSNLLDRQFPVASAVFLYGALFAPAERCIAGKRLILAPDAQLLSVPVNALLTAPIAADANGLYDLRTAPWMVPRHAVSFVPSVSSFVFLRRTATPASTQFAFLGIGAPSLAQVEISVAVTPGALFVSRGQADTNLVRLLPELPNTADELTVLSEALGPAASDLLLGDEATEQRVRRQRLSEYRVIAFATHGLVAGDFEGIVEPALVLTPSDGAGPSNDGLLTASEVSTLTLDADLVILSACNTALEDGTPNAKGLGKLANAFFFSGARAIAATQWSVMTTMAERLSTGMVQHAEQSGLGFASGLQQSMLDILTDESQEYLAHPRFWAPFILIGEGAAPKLDRRPNQNFEVVWERLGPLYAPDTAAGVLTIDDGVLVTGFTAGESSQANRAAGYIKKLTPGGELVWRKVDQTRGPLNAIVAFEDYSVVAAAGGWTEQAGTSAIFVAVDSDGSVRWENGIDAPVYDSAAAIEIMPDGDSAILAIQHSNLTNQANFPPMAVTIQVVGSDGSISADNQWSFPNWQSNAHISTIHVRPGEIIIAITGEESTSSQTRHDPLTGLLTACAWSRFTDLVYLDAETLGLKGIAHVTAAHIKKIRNVGDREMLALADLSGGCGLDSDVALAHFDQSENSTLALRIISPLNERASDFAILDDGRIVIAGTVDVPFDLTRPTDAEPSLVLGDISLWERPNERANAFLFLIDGTSIGSDRIFGDPVARGFSALTLTDDNQVIAVGMANGGQPWVAALQIPN